MSPIVPDEHRAAPTYFHDGIVYALHEEAAFSPRFGRPML